MKLLSLILAPALALCGTYSGTVVSLDGTPVAGATIKVGADSVTTTPNGSWSLARSAGIFSKPGKTIPVTTHLTLENGRPRLSFGGMDISGRAAQEPSVGAIPSSLAAARNQAASDTLRVYWKGKRLTVLPVPGDTGSIAFRIDTAWKDDAEIPWNPRVEYGSLLDARDGQTYRTVSLGSQTWMAENLDFLDRKKYIGACWGEGPAGSSPQPQNCKVYGALYGWSTASNGDSASSSLPGTMRGICPSGWHVPSDTEWSAMTQQAATLSGTPGNDAAHALKSTAGWNTLSFNGLDLLGFRVLPGGYHPWTSIDGNWLGLRQEADFWTSSRSATNPDDFHFRQVKTDNSPLPSYTSYRSNGFSLRCVKD